jgi:hypothetical protein
LADFNTTCAPDPGFGVRYLEPGRVNANWRRSPARRCSSLSAGCQANGKGDRVGPDLKGVTARQNRDGFSVFAVTLQR